MWWLRLVVQAVRRKQPGMAIVLGLAGAPSHVAYAFMHACCRRQVRSVVIPTKMAWRLQPLDTHVFGTLKATFRELEFQMQAGNRSYVIARVE